VNEVDHQHINKCPKKKKQRRRLMLHALGEREGEKGKGTGKGVSKPKKVVQFREGHTHMYVCTSVV
jgi:hypothetical protein